MCVCVCYIKYQHFILVPKRKSCQHLRPDTCFINQILGKELTDFFVFCKLLCNMKSPFPVESHHLNTEGDVERLDC